MVRYKNGGCINGHMSGRYASGQCIECARLNARRWRVENAGHDQGRKKVWAQKFNVENPGYSNIRRGSSWRAYFGMMLSRKRTLTTDQLMQVLERQNYKCALTGKLMTYITGVGKGRNRPMTNASIDRIKAGGPYAIDNIQLVCHAVNQWRGPVPLNEFIHWCHLVAEKAGAIKTCNEEVQGWEASLGV